MLGSRGCREILKSYELSAFAAFEFSRMQSEDSKSYTPSSFSDPRRRYQRVEP